MQKKKKKEKRELLGDSERVLSLQECSLEGGIQRGVKEVRHSEGLFSGRRAEERYINIKCCDFLWNSVIKQF